jgi:hypothetical protein
MVWNGFGHFILINYHNFDIYEETNVHATPYSYLLADYVTSLYQCLSYGYEVDHRPNDAVFSNSFSQEMLSSTFQRLP